MAFVWSEDIGGGNGNLVKQKKAEGHKGQRERTDTPRRA